MMPSVTIRRYVQKLGKACLTTLTQRHKDTVPRSLSALLHPHTDTKTQRHAHTEPRSLPPDFRSSLERTICVHASPMAHTSMTQKKTWRVSSGSCVLAAALRVDVLISSRHAFNPICVTTMRMWMNVWVGGGEVRVKMQIRWTHYDKHVDRTGYHIGLLQCPYVIQSMCNHIGLLQQQRQRLN